MIKLNNPDSVRQVRLCQICASQRLRQTLDLGLHPTCTFRTEGELRNNGERLFPLVVMFCEACGCVQSQYVVDPKVLFGQEYHHVSGIPVTFRKHVGEFAKSLVKEFALGSRDLVVDIGSSDGAFLGELQRLGVKVLGVDPSDVARIAVQNGVPTIGEFFGESVATEIRRQFGQAKVITAMNTFAHVAELDSLIRGVKLLLDDSGAFVTESHYLSDMIVKLQYDFAYHEHLRYYSLEVLKHLFGRYGMTLFDAQRIPTHGGSIRVYACNADGGESRRYRTSRSVKALLGEENALKLSKLRTHQLFARRTQSHRRRLRATLLKLKQEGKRIVGVTCPARGVTLLQYCGIGSEILDYITEKSPLKVGRVTPGTHVRIVEESKLVTDSPDYALLLSWHLTEELVPKLRGLGFKGKFIIPLPEPKII